jgi:hypothetical protein
VSSVGGKIVRREGIGKEESSRGEGGRRKGGSGGKWSVGGGN